MVVDGFLKSYFEVLTCDPRPSYFHVAVNDDQLWTLVNCFPFLCVLFKHYCPALCFDWSCVLVFMQRKISLHFLFGKNFEGATRIVEQRGVSKISAHPSGRFIFQVSPSHLSSIALNGSNFA